MLDDVNIRTQTSNMMDGKCPNDDFIKKLSLSTCRLDIWLFVFIKLCSVFQG